jgi:hypothetical protein
MRWEKKCERLNVWCTPELEPAVFQRMGILLTLQESFASPTLQTPTSPTTENLTRKISRYGQGVYKFTIQAPQGQWLKAKH